MQVGTLDNVDFTSQGFRSRSHPSIDADPGGRVFVVWASNTDTSGNDDSDIYITSSTDGATWTAPICRQQRARRRRRGRAVDAVGRGRPGARSRHVLTAGTTKARRSTRALRMANVAATPTFTEVVVSSAAHADDHRLPRRLQRQLRRVGQRCPSGMGRRSSGQRRLDRRVYRARRFLAAFDGDAQPVRLTKPWGQSAMFTATVTGAHGEAEQFIPVAFTVSGGGTPVSLVRIRDDRCVRTRLVHVLQRRWRAPIRSRRGPT